jgi:predicted nucleotidyltransferase
MPLGNLSEQEADAVRAYVGVLQRRFGDRLVDTFVFGSRARGESHPDSDVDVMVVLEHPSGKDLSEARGLAFDIWLTYQVLLSIRAMSQQHWQGCRAFSTATPCMTPFARYLLFNAKFLKNISSPPRMKISRRRSRRICSPAAQAVD